MTNRKSYNSILFLTVYLGLVLVGGSSQVFAHAATNSLFDIRNEIEFKEDFDNKPDESCAELKDKLTEQDIQFIEDYAKLVSVSLKKYSANTQFEMLAGIDDKDFPSLRKDLKPDYIHIKLDGKSFYSNFYFKFKRENQNPALATIAFNSSLQFQICRNQNNPKKAIYESTTALFSDSQVFIVTRLPRGSIDSLLK